MNEYKNNVIQITKHKSIDLNLISINQTFPSKADFYSTLGIDYSNGLQTKRIKEIITLKKTNVPKEVIITDIKYPTSITQGVVNSKTKNSNPLSGPESDCVYSLIEKKEYKSFRQLLCSIGLKYSSDNIKKIKRHIDYEQLSGSHIKITEVYDVDGLLDGMKYNSATFWFFISLVKYLQNEKNTKELTVRQIQEQCYPVQLLFESEEWIKYKETHKDKTKDLNNVQRIIEKNAYGFVYDQLLRHQKLNRIKVEKIYYTFIDGKEELVPEYLIPKIKDIQRYQHVNSTYLKEEEFKNIFNTLLYKETGYDNVHIKWSIGFINPKFFEIKLKPNIIDSQSYFDHALNLLHTNELKILLKAVFKNFLK